MKMLRDLVGPFKGQTRPYLDHEADAALSGGYAERVVDEPAVAERVVHVSPPEVVKPAVRQPAAKPSTSATKTS